MLFSIPRQLTENYPKAKSHEELTEPAVGFEMSYYHVRMVWKLPEQKYLNTDYELDLSEEEARLFGEQYEKGEVFFRGKWVDSHNIHEIEIRRTLSKSTNYFPQPLDGPQIFYGNKAAAEIVTRKFIKSSPKKEVLGKQEKAKQTFNKNIFIVHGNDHEPMKELKEMLFELGFNPIVLHEQVSGGSSTLPEKLEEYSKDVGYAFVILTPDDIGGQRAAMRKKLGADKSFLYKELTLLTSDVIDGMLNDFEPRARQNVIFEMGYFWGLLERKRVCCLLKGNVQSPSDIEGIVYIRFENSIRKEVRLDIMKVLKKAEYEIEI